MKDDRGLFVSMLPFLFIHRLGTSTFDFYTSLYGSPDFYRLVSVAQILLHVFDHIKIGLFAFDCKDLLLVRVSGFALSP